MKFFLFKETKREVHSWVKEKTSKKLAQRLIISILNNDNNKKTVAIKVQ